MAKTDFKDLKSILFEFYVSLKEGDYEDALRFFCTLLIMVSSLRNPCLEFYTAYSCLTR
jgi:hypothetical protein